VPEEVIQLPYKWVPRIDQMPLWQYLQGGGLRGIEIAHRRWGKDEIALRWTSVAMHKRVGNYWHMLPQYSQARKAVWEAINPRTGKYRIDEAFPDPIRASTRNTDMVIQAKVGSQWQLVGSDNFNSIVGSPPIGIVFSEWALANPLAWAYLQPILEENGGWALFITSSRGNNHAIRTYNAGKTDPKWFAEILRADQTGVFTPEQLERIEAELIAQFGAELGRTIYNQEYLCSSEGAVLGAYYDRQMEQAKKEGRITRVPHRPGLEVFTAWDLGVDDSMSIWFIQPVGRGFDVIDYYENTGYGLEHYAKILREEHRGDYLYGGHYMPHDAAIREMSGPGEIAKSREEVAEDLGIRPIIVVKRVKNVDMLIQSHIPAVRNLIPLCRFDEEKCARGIAALEGYQSEFDEKSKVLGQRPLHNWCSHGADAFRTFAVGYEDIPTPPQKTSKVLDLMNSGSASNWEGL
jgi:phage terminase large subunit